MQGAVVGLAKRGRGGSKAMPEARTSIAKHREPIPHVISYLPQIGQIEATDLGEHDELKFWRRMQPLRDSLAVHGVRMHIDIRLGSGYSRGQSCTSRRIIISLERLLFKPHARDLRCTLFHCLC